MPDFSLHQITTWLSKRPVQALILLLAVVAAWIGYSHFSDESSNGAAPARVTAVEAVRRDVPVNVSLVGSAIAYETVAIKSRLDSQIVKVHFKDGDDVKEGQLLFELDDRALKAQIDQLAAALEKEKAQLANDRLQFERLQKLAKTKAASQAQLDEARANYQGQQAQIEAARAALDNARVLLSYTTITAPISGRTGTINVTRGNNVKANDAQPLVTINRISPIRAQFAIPQRYYEPVKAAQASGIAVTAQPGESAGVAKGKLEYIDNAIDAGSGTFTARAVFPNEDETLWPGMFVRVSIHLGMRRQALTVPAVAVQGDEDQRFVFVVGADNKSARTPVEIADNDGEIAIVTGGLKDGDRVVTDGLLRLTDGAAVDVVETP